MNFKIVDYAEEVTINYINYWPFSEVTIITVTLMDITNSWILGVAFFSYFIDVFAKNYVVVNCLIEVIRFIVKNVTAYTPANFRFLTNST